MHATLFACPFNTTPNNRYAEAIKIVTKRSLISSNNNNMTVKQNKSNKIE